MRIICTAVSTVYALMITSGLGRWAVRQARMERGYDAIGGEYIFILVVFIAAYMIIHNLFRLLEEKRNGNSD